MRWQDHTNNNEKSELLNICNRSDHHDASFVVRIYTHKWFMALSSTTTTGYVLYRFIFGYYLLQLVVIYRTVQLHNWESSTQTQVTYTSNSLEDLQYQQHIGADSSWHWAQKRPNGEKAHSSKQRPFAPKPVCQCAKRNLKWYVANWKSPKNQST